MVKKSSHTQPAGHADDPVTASSGPDPHDKTLSRTQRKLASKSLQQLGQRLAALRDSERAALDLPTDILAAVTDLNSMRSHIARKRQMLYLGKLLRRIDAGDIIRQLEHSEQHNRQQVASQHRAEHWREHLLQHGDQALQALLDHMFSAADQASAQPVAEPQQWRALLRQAQQQQRAGKPPAASRKLYRLLYAADQAQPLPPVLD